MKYTIQHIQEQFNNEKVLKYLFFWGHTSTKDGSIGKSCFSQWWNHSFKVAGIEYKTDEHWMVAEKARLFNDHIILEEVIACNQPMEVKKLGRKVKNFDPQIWNDHNMRL